MFNSFFNIFKSKEKDKPKTEIKYLTEEEIKEDIRQKRLNRMQQESRIEEDTNKNQETQSSSKLLEESKIDQIQTPI